MQPWDNFSQFELIWTSYDCPAFMIRYSNTGGANKEVKIHPTQKPVPVYVELLKKFGKPGYKILDTHAGSASSLVACHLFSYEYIGFEINEYFYNKAISRIETYKAQISLFDKEGDCLQRIQMS